MGKHRTLRSSGNGLADKEVIAKRDAVLPAVLEAMAAEGVHVTPEEATGKDRHYHKVVARSMVTYILYAHYRMGPTAVGKALGIDHSTIIHQRHEFTNKAETIAWVGRAYISACKALRLNPLKWIKPKTEGAVFKVYTSKHTGSKLIKEQKPDGASVVTKLVDDEVKAIDYTPEERARLKLLMKYPGGVPRTELENFHRKFGTEL